MAEAGDVFLGLDPPWTLAIDGISAIKSLLPPSRRLVQAFTASRRESEENGRAWPGVVAGGDESPGQLTQPQPARQGP